MSWRSCPHPNQSFIVISFMNIILFCTFISIKRNIPGACWWLVRFKSNTPSIASRVKNCWVNTARQSEANFDLHDSGTCKRIILQTSCCEKEQTDKLLFVTSLAKTWRIESRDNQESAGWQRACGEELADIWQWQWTSSFVRDHCRFSNQEQREVLQDIEKYSWSTFSEKGDLSIA